MTQQILNVGTAPNDHTGDSIRVGAQKTNANFTELYEADAAVPYFYATDYGVVADGVTSDDVAMGLAAAAASAVGGKLVLPPGVILLNGTGNTHITLNGCWMEGSGGNSAIQSQQQGTTFNLTSTSIVPFYLQANFKVSNCNFYWPNQITGTVVYPSLFTDGGTAATAMKHGTIDNITIINAYDGLTITNGLSTSDVKIVNSTFYACHYLFNMRNTGDSWVLGNNRFTPGPWLATTTFSTPVANAVNTAASVNAIFHVMTGGATQLNVLSMSAFGWRYAVLVDSGGSIGNSSFNWTLDGIGSIVDSSSGGSFAIQNKMTGSMTTCGVVTYVGGGVGTVSVGGNTNAFVLGTGSGLRLDNFRVDATTGNFIVAATTNIILINDLTLSAIGTVADGGEYYFLNATGGQQTLRMYDSTVVGKASGPDAHEHGINYQTADSVSTGNFILENNLFSSMSDILTMSTGNILIIKNNVSVNTYASGYTLNVTGAGKAIYSDNYWDIDPIAMVPPVSRAPSPVNVWNWGVPVGMPSSGTIGNNGALTLTTALPVIFPASYMYFPANAISAGSALGVYYVIMSSTTVGVIYNNPLSSGKPVVITSPIPFVTTGPGAYTQTTGQTTFLSISIPAGSFGSNGALIFEGFGIRNNSANGVTWRVIYGGSTFAQVSAANVVWYGIRRTLRNTGATNSQVSFPPSANVGAETNTSTAAPNYLAIDTTTAHDITLATTDSTATDWFFCLGGTITINYGGTN